VPLEAAVSLWVYEVIPNGIWHFNEGVAFDRDLLDGTKVIVVVQVFLNVGEHPIQMVIGKLVTCKENMIPFCSILLTIPKSY
jgi:hypothetical protein